MANPQGIKVFAVERHGLPENFVSFRSLWCAIVVKAENAPNGAISLTEESPVAPVVQLTTSKPSDVRTWDQISAQSHELVFSLTSCPTSGER